MKTYICTSGQMKNAEQNADLRGVSYLQLMENAGRALAVKTAELSGDSGDVCGRQILILCGKGNNGGDGFAASRYLAQMGAAVTVGLTHGEPQDGISRDNFLRLKALGECGESSEKPVTIGFADPNDNFGRYDIIIDCVFGTGFHGEFSDEIRLIFEKINQCCGLKIAADVPSGVNSTDGSACENSFSANATVTFGGLKIGLMLPPGKAFCGKIIAADIGIKGEDFEKIGFVPRLYDRLPPNFLPPRGEFSHKGCFGRLGIIAGSAGMSGAAALNVLGALRSGAGIVRIASVKTALDRIMGGIYECMGIELKETSEGLIALCDENINKIHVLADMSEVMAIGSGLGGGKNPDIQRIVEECVKVCRTKKIPLIIDGDGLNCLAGRIDIISAENKADFPLILTPHPAELARLLGVGTSEVLGSRLEMAARLAEKTGAVVAAKGFPTYTVSPTGRAAASFSGNGGLSRGGSGDLLTGVISGLTAARKGFADGDIFDTVCGGVYIFGAAADITAEELSMTGMLPSDAAQRLCAAYKTAEKEKTADN